MSKIIRIVILVISLEIIQISPLKAQTELIISPDGNQTSVNTLQVRGITENRINYIVNISSINSSQNSTEIIINADEIGDYVANLPVTDFPYVDLLSLNIMSRIIDGRTDLILTLSYGAPRDECFVNHDGRNYVVIVFSQGRAPSIHNVSFDNCQM